MRNRDLLVAVCLALMIHAGAFLISPSRSTIEPGRLEKKTAIQISLLEAPRPKPLSPNRSKDPPEVARVEKLLKTRPEPRPRLQPQRKPKPKLIEDHSLSEITSKEDTDLPEREGGVKPEEELSPVRSALSNGETKGIEEERNADKSAFSPIESLEEREVVRESKPLLPSDPPSYLENPKPRYPLLARRKKIEGVVLLRVEVLPTGRVGRIEVKRSSGYKILDRSALRAVKEWKFSPARMNGMCIAVWTSVPIRFKLER
ncbi:MAG: energy transducer TonB [Pseudomonadota bacterium]